MDTIKKEEPQIDPLRRVFIPREKRKEDGTHVLYTSDKTKYVRGTDGTIRRATPKVNGKEARRARLMARKERERMEKKIQTTHGPMLESELSKEQTIENGMEVVSYYLGEELVHRSATVQLKGVEAEATAQKL